MLPVRSTTAMQDAPGADTADLTSPDDATGNRDDGHQDSGAGGDSARRDSPASPDTVASRTEEADRGRARRRLSMAGTVLACMAAAFALHFARPVMLPVVFALLIAVTLRPLVRRARRRRVPETLSSAVLIIGMVCLAVTAAVFVAGPAREWTTDLPRRMEEVGEKLAFFREQVQDFEEASEKIKNITDGQRDDEAGTSFSPLGGMPVAAQPDQQSHDPVPVEVRRSRIVTAVNVLSSAGGVIGSIAIALVMGFFLLSRGDVLLNNFLHILPTMREKRNVVELVYDVEYGISRYLLTVALINSALGIAIGTAMWLLGMPNPALWGVMATLLNFVPYLGAMTGTFVVFLVAVLSFDSAAYACVVPLVYFSLTALEGNVMTPSILGRTMQLNPIMVLLSLVFWGWMWGVGGALLAVPILATLKIAFDRFEWTRAIGTLLGGEDG